MAAVGYANPYIGVECALDDVLETLNKGYSAGETRKQWMLEKLDWSIEHMSESPIKRTSRVGTLS